MTRRCEPYCVAVFLGPVDSHSIFVIDSGGHVCWRQLAPDTMHVPVSDVIAALKRA